MAGRPKKLRPARITLKRLIWDGAKKLPAGTVFVDKECFNGKYNPNTADVKYIEEKPADPPKTSGEEDVE